MIRFTPALLALSLLGLGACVSSPDQTPAAAPAAAASSKAPVCVRQPPTLGSRVGEIVCEEAE